MAKQEDKNDGLMKTGTSRRSRAGRAGRGGTMPRIMVLALLVVVAGGAALFWPRGGGVPTGIGEQQTVVAAPSETPVVPHSGDVDINAASAPALIPEKPQDQAAAEQAATKAAATEPAPVKSVPVQQPATKTVTPPPVKTETKTVSPAQPKVEPRPDGPYAVQVGAFGQAENADQEAARLKAKGWDARVRAGNNSSGDMVYRVWIGYFASRTEAQTFISQNSKLLAGAIPVHR